MKDTILNTTLVASLFASVVFSAFGNSQSPSHASAAGMRVVEMEKTVVVANRTPDMLLASVTVN